MRISLGVILFVACYAVQAQRIDPYVIGNAGHVGKSGQNNQLHWTLGELATTTIGNATYKITQGFHQAILRTTAVESPVTFEGIRVFPNPTMEFLNISNEKGLELQIQVHDLNGIEVHNKKIQSDEQLDFNGLPSGEYILRLADKQSYQLFKIQKIQ